MMKAHMKSPLSKSKVISYLLAAAGAVIVVIGVYRFIRGETADASVATGAGLVLLFAANIEHFELLKALGVEVRTWKLEKTLESAEGAVAQLKKLTEVSAKTLMRISLADPKATSEQLYDLSRSVKDMLESNGDSKAGIHSALEPWIVQVNREIYRHIFRQFSEQLEIDYAAVRIAHQARRDSGEQVPMLPDKAGIPNFNKLRDGWTTCATSIEILELLNAVERLNVPGLTPEETASIQPAYRELKTLIGVWRPQFEKLNQTLDWEDEGLWRRGLTDRSYWKFQAQGW